MKPQYNFGYFNAMQSYCQIKFHDAISFLIISILSCIVIILQKVNMVTDIF